MPISINAGVIKHSTKVSIRKDRRGIKAGRIADAMNRELEAYWRGLDEGKAPTPMSWPTGPRWTF
jgi:hypothetical protein